MCVSLHPEFTQEPPPVVESDTQFLAERRAMPSVFAIFPPSTTQNKRSCTIYPFARHLQFRSKGRPSKRPRINNHDQNPRRCTPKPLAILKRKKQRQISGATAMNKFGVSGQLSRTNGSNLQAEGQQILSRHDVRLKTAVS